MLIQNYSRQLKVKIAQEVLKMCTCWYGKKAWVITESLKLTLTATSYLNRNSYLYSYKQERRNMAVIQISIIIPFTLNFLSEM